MGERRRMLALGRGVGGVAFGGVGFWLLLLLMEVLEELEARVCWGMMAGLMPLWEMGLDSLGLDE